MAPLVLFSEEKSPSGFHILGGLVTVVSERELFARNVMLEGGKCGSISENDGTRGKQIGDEVSQAGTRTILLQHQLNHLMDSLDTQIQTSDFGLLQQESSLQKNVINKDGVDIK
ncbi:hypothetical protein FRC15_004703 [Serendipita sp. 397]|nr:hypothetical protein FRC15_004703 [Serendipita sp. 397]